jgi:hypothetical protein
LTQWPTARQLVADGQDTPLRVVEVAPLRLAIGWVVQVLPFHRSAKGDPRPPTAVHADAELHDTAASGPPGAGGIRDHELPFHLSANGRILPVEVTSVPTATQARAEVHDTPRSRLSVAPAGFGVDWITHAEPFQCSANVSSVPPPAKYSPTAVQDAALGQETAPSRLAVEPGGLGVGSTLFAAATWTAAGVTA